MIYLDYAASAPVLPEAAAAALRFMTEEYANPSSIHQAAAESRGVIDHCRRQLAKMLNCAPEEIIFTSGGTESNNLAVFGTCGGKIRTLVTTAIEHESVLKAAEAWAAADPERKLVILKPDEKGVIAAEFVEQALAEAASPVFVSVMTANNELGTIQPVHAIGAVCRKYGALFHTDAVQAFGHIPLDVKECGIGLLSASGHKCGAPKGVGFLYASKQAGLEPMIFGGGQERGLRSGTLNTPGIAGLYEAAKYAEAHMKASAERISSLRCGFYERIKAAIPDVIVNGPEVSELTADGPADGSFLPGHLNVSFPGVEAESLLILLDLRGIAASAGSACASGSLEPSHVLMALPGMTEERANASLRFTFGEFTTEEECGAAAEAVIESVRKLLALRYS